MDKLKSVEDLFFRAGGSVHIAAYLDVNQWTVERWRVIGIPDSYHPRLCSKFDCTREDLIRISDRAIRLSHKEVA